MTKMWFTGDLILFIYFNILLLSNMHIWLLISCVNSGLASYGLVLISGTMLSGVLSMVLAFLASNELSLLITVSSLQYEFFINISVFLALSYLLQITWCVCFILFFLLVIGPKMRVEERCRKKKTYGKKNDFSSNDFPSFFAPKNAFWY